MNTDPVVPVGPRSRGYESLVSVMSDTFGYETQGLGVDTVFVGMKHVIMVSSSPQRTWDT